MKIILWELSRAPNRKAEIRVFLNGVTRRGKHHLSSVQFFSSLPPPPLLSPSLSKNPLLLYSFLSRTLMNFRDKHTNLLYKNMAAVHVTLRTKHSLRSSSLVSLRHDPPCDVHFLSFFSFSSFFFFFFFFFPAPNFPIFYADDFPRLIKLEERFLTFLHRDKRTCNFHNL